MGVNGKRKGSKNERGVSKLFETWTGFEFARTPGSGGLHWKGRADTSGDIVCISKEEKDNFPFSIEAKSYKEINFEHLLYLDNPDILKFWEQAKADAEEHEKEPLLFMRYNGLPRDFHFVGINLSLFNKIMVHLQKPKHPYIKYVSEKAKIVFITSDSLFFYDYKKLKSLIS